jgi:hypothetical protein
MFEISIHHNRKKIEQILAPYITSHLVSYLTEASVAYVTENGSPDVLWKISAFPTKPNQS